MALTQNPYDILFDPSVNPFVSSRSGPIRRNPITTQPTARPTNLAGQQLYTWSDGSVHTTQEPTVGNPSNPGGVSYRWSDGTYHDTPEPAAAAAAPPDTRTPQEIAGWFGGPDQSYRWFGDPATKNYYEEHPSEGWQQYINWGMGERDTNLKQFALSRYQQSLADYDLLNEKSPNTMYVDTMTPALMDHIRTLFYDQNAAQKGYVNAWMPAGRAS